MHVREATPADAEALASLSGQLGYPADVPTILRRLAQVERSVVLVAVNASDEVCAVAHAEPRRLLIAEPFVELAALVVDQLELRRSTTELSYDTSICSSSTKWMAEATTAVRATAPPSVCA